MLKIRENGATSGIGVLATFAYDDLGRRTSLSRGNGTVTSYVHDAVSRLQSLTQDLAGTANDLVLGFTYNPASQIVTNTRSNDLYAWTQHGSGTTTTSANGLNQLAGWNGTLSHDAKGNITAVGSTAYTYSSENLLTSAPGYTLTYDPLMRLQAVTGAITNRRLYDGDEMIVEYNPAGAIARRIVHGPGIDEPLVWYGSGGTTRRFLHADERGSIVSATDVNGAPIVTYRYDEYGGWGAGNSGRYYYTGQTGYDELKLYYYKARWYHPGIGRFLQPDPVGYGSGMNLYAYVGGDPVNVTDPSGMIGETCTGSLINRCNPRDGNRGCVSCMVSHHYFSRGGNTSSGPRGGTGNGGSSTTSGQNDIPSIDASSIVVTGFLTAGGEIGSLSDLTGAGGVSVEPPILVSARLWRPGPGLLLELRCLIMVCGNNMVAVYRVVNDRELADIQDTGTYRVRKGGVGGKFFYQTFEQALYNGGKFAVLFEEVYTVTSSRFRLDQLTDIHPAGEGPSWFVHERYFPHGPVSIHVRILPHKM